MTTQERLRKAANQATITEAAEILSCSRDILHSAVGRGAIPSTRTRGRRIHIDLEDAEEYLRTAPAFHQRGTSRELLAAGLSPAQVAERLGIKLASARRTAARMGKAKS